MISFGRKVVDREDVAVLAGKAVGTLRNLGAFKALTPVAGGGRGTKELYDLEQARFLASHLPRTKTDNLPQVPAATDVCALSAEQLRAEVRRVLLEEEQEGVVGDLTIAQADALGEQDLRAWVRGRELLTLEEARMAVPHERRPTKSTMESYYRGSKATRLPEPDAVFYGVAFWTRATIERWNSLERRPAHGIKGHGRPAGTSGATAVPVESAEKTAASVIVDEPTVECSTGDANLASAVTGPVGETTSLGEQLVPAGTTRRFRGAPASTFSRVVRPRRPPANSEETPGVPRGSHPGPVTLPRNGYGGCGTSRSRGHIAESSGLVGTAWPNDVPSTWGGPPWT
ncbi:hypothetical protein OG871_40105 (plasmid) [Kitasatospora sp. NBC_00374]|uniref:hypothetical protein n=1 Tax=Kitasatospora sp. NBC_00374 TaxID=2975964 RepID=UPI002F914F1B